MCSEAIKGRIAGLASFCEQKGAKMEAVVLELKYCERCGSLGLRRPHSAELYCESCAELLAPPVFWLRGGRRHVHRRQGHKLPAAVPVSRRQACEVRA
jgi:hypothetical protein